MQLILREPEAEDWPAILALADRASPWKSKANPAWLANRKRAGASNERCFHLLAEAVSGEVQGYAALEEGEKPGWLRIFLVVEREQLGTLGELLYLRLEKEWMRLKPDGVWLREEPGDSELLAFFKERDFNERLRSRLPDGLAIVVMGKEQGENGSG
jgi:hypothetical protein